MLPAGTSRSQAVVSGIEALSREAGVSLRESEVRPQYENLLAASDALKKAMGTAPFVDLGDADDKGTAGGAVAIEAASETAPIAPGSARDGVVSKVFVGVMTCVIGLWCSPFLRRMRVSLLCDLIR